MGRGDKPLKSKSFIQLNNQNWKKQKQKQKQKKRKNILHYPNVI